MSNLNDYVNITLKKDINFDETYSVTQNYDKINNKMNIDIQSNKSNPKLIKLLKFDDEFYNSFRIYVDRLIKNKIPNYDTNSLNITLYDKQINIIFFPKVRGKNTYFKLIPDELSATIQLYLFSNDDIVSFCELIEVEDNRIYWKNFYTILFDTSLYVNLIIDNKRYYENYCEQYLYLLKSDNPDEEAERGRLDALIWLSYKDILPSKEGANRAAEKGHLEILKWLFTKGVLPSVHVANSAAASGRLEVLKWLSTKNIFPNEQGANLAAMTGKGHLEILKWLFETKGILPDEDGANWAAENGHLEVLKWLAERGIHPTT